MLLGNGCRKDRYPFDKSALTYKGKFVYENQIRLDGFYYKETDDATGYGVRYFYEDGVSFKVGVEENDFDPNSSLCFQIHPRNRDLPYLWGYYIIEGDILKEQTYDPGSRQRYSKFQVEERWAVIENPTTIRFFKRITPEKNEIALDEVYHFRECTDKPDSTNILMR